jgi:hypothetical protein
MASEDKQTTQQTQQSKTEPWAPAQDYLKAALAKISGMSTAPTAGQTAGANNLVTAAGEIPNFGATASGELGDIFNFNTLPQQGMLSSALADLTSNIGGTARGEELDPYKTPGFSDALNTLTNDITKNVKSTYMAAGRDPSGAGSFAGSLGKGLISGAAPILQSQFNTNKANQMNAANTLFGGAGSTASGITQQQMSPLTAAMQGIGLIPAVSGAYTLPATAQLDAANVQADQPLNQLLKYLSPVTSIAGLGGQTEGSGTSTTTQPHSAMSNIMGGLMGGLGLMKMFMGSDERIKENIEPVGELKDGQTVYSYNYIGDEMPQIGLIAQEVMEHRPDAVANIGGILHVNYATATENARRMA